MPGRKNSEWHTNQPGFSSYKQQPNIFKQGSDNAVIWKEKSLQGIEFRGRRPGHH